MVMKINFAETVFGKTFLGEEVEILIDLKTRLTSEDEQGVMMQEQPIAVTGFLLDIDEEYYYLGKTPDKIIRSIRKEYMVGIEIIEQKSEVDVILDNFEPNGVGN